MADRVVGIADFLVSLHPEDVLVTFGLGSCVAVVVHDARRRIGGMLHLMLPSGHGASSEGVLARPSRFADLGIPLLFNQLRRLGCRREDLAVWLVGGASVGPEVSGILAIGERNVAATRRILSDGGFPIRGEDLGGRISRTVRLHVGTGGVEVTSAGQMRSLQKRAG